MYTEDELIPFDDSGFNISMLSEALLRQTFPSVLGFLKTPLFALSIAFVTQITVFSFRFLYSSDNTTQIFKGILDN